LGYFFHSSGHELILTKKGWAKFCITYFFKNSSGHPDSDKAKKISTRFRKNIFAAKEVLPVDPLASGSFRRL
jgi:hypothetical protein